MRKFMLGTALAVALAVTGCTTAQINQLDQVTAAFIQGVQELTAAACGVIPEASAITAVFNATAGATMAAVGAAICKAAPPKSSARYAALPLRAGGAAPAVIGTTATGVVVTGWRARAVHFGHRRH